MFKLDDDFLRDCGLAGLPAEHRPSLLETVYLDLELRVGTAISAAVSPAQLAAFEELMDRGAPDQEKQAWLEANVPDYKEAVDAAVRDVRAHLRRRGTDILQYFTGASAPDKGDVEPQQ